MIYVVEQYHPDTGHEEIARVDALAEARAVVRDALGLRRLHPSRRWGVIRDGLGVVEENYIEVAPSHRDAEYGCGGYTIRRAGGTRGDWNVAA